LMMLEFFIWIHNLTPGEKRQNEIILPQLNSNHPPINISTNLSPYVFLKRNSAMLMPTGLERTVEVQVSGNASETYITCSDKIRLINKGLEETLINIGCLRTQHITPKNVANRAGF
jgi:hypothetical protein